MMVFDICGVRGSPGGKVADVAGGHELAPSACCVTRLPHRDSRLDPHLSIAQIAQRGGYASAAAFKRATGTAPCMISSLSSQIHIMPALFLLCARDPT